MDQLMQLLFNPNHEMPSGWVLVIIVVVCIATSYIMQNVQSRRGGNTYSDGSQKKSSGKKSGKKK